MKMKIKGLVLVSFLVPCAIYLTVFSAATDGNPPKAKYHAVVIQGGGYLPDAKKPEGVDAITQPTTKGINTYSLTTVLIGKLAAMDTDVKVVPFSACKDLTCLSAAPDRAGDRADVVIFAGPAHFSKQPEQLAALYPKLKEVVARHPGLLCSTIIPAWYPESKGKEAMAVADKAFKEAGARSVPGVTILTPREDQKGASAEEVDKAMTEFVTRLVDALKNAK